MKNSYTLAILLLMALTGSAAARDLTISIPMQQVRVLSGESGQFYFIHVSLPAELDGKRLDSAMIEFSVDAEAIALADSVATPVFGAYPLTSPYNADAQPSGAAATPAFDKVVPSARPIAFGERNVLRMDITDTVKAWIENPQSNFGLVIGSLTGPKIGTVMLNTTLSGSDSAIRITFFYQNRFGDRAATGQ